FQYPETADVLLGLGVWPVGDKHRTIRLLPHRLCVAGRGNSAGELPHAGSNHFAVERVDLLNHRFGYGGRVEVVGKVASNQILRHVVSCKGLWVGPLPGLHYIHVERPDRNSTKCPRNSLAAALAFPLERNGSGFRLLLFQPTIRPPNWGV